MNSKGFTVIELMVVVLITGVLAAISLPLTRPLIRRAQEVEVLVYFEQLEPLLWQYRVEAGEWPTDQLPGVRPEGISESVWNAEILNSPVDYENWSFGNGQCGVHLTWMGPNNLRDHDRHELLGPAGAIAEPGDDKVKIIHLRKCDLPKGSVR